MEDRSREENRTQPEAMDGVDRARRRMLQIAAYAAPFLLTFAMPESSWAQQSSNWSYPACALQGTDCNPTSPPQGTRVAKQDDGAEAPRRRAARPPRQARPGR